MDDRREAARQLADAERSADAAAIASNRTAFTAAEQNVKGVRAEAIALVKDVSGDSTYNDVNYVFPTYIVTQLPVGLVGLLMAAIFAAAMSTISGELSALSTSTVIDFYRRWVRDDGDEKHLLLGVEGRDVVLGGVCVDRRDLGRGAGLADRSGQSIRIVLLRIDPRRVPAGDRMEPRELDGRLRRPDRGHECRRLGDDSIRRSRFSGTT